MPTDVLDPELAALRFARHALTTRFTDLPPAAIRAAKTFLLDTFGVGVAGSIEPSAEPLLQAAARAAGELAFVDIVPVPFSQAA
jgi:2-methylcitrate dehydratase PrpD